jgi:hypothetical protein
MIIRNMRNDVNNKPLRIRCLLAVLNIPEPPNPWRPLFVITLLHLYRVLMGFLGTSESSFSPHLELDGCRNLF